MSNFGRENHHEAMPPWEMQVLPKITYFKTTKKIKKKNQKLQKSHSHP
jgi:hypothetical protein